MKHLRKFTTAAQYSAATIYRPSVSLIEENRDTIFDPLVKIKGLTISGETNVTNMATYTVTYMPSNTTETGVTWSVVSGNQYATIGANTGELTALNGADSSTVIIRATSVVNSSFTDELTLSVTYLPLLKFTSKQVNSTIGLSKKSRYHTLEYSTDGETWSNMTTSSNITLSNVGDYVYVRGVLSSNQTSSDFTQFKMSGNIKASGIINYLWNKDNPDSALKEDCGYGLFSGCTALTDASELLLPATTLAAYCYNGMFSGCTSLTTAPILPATTLAYYCYCNMFRGCTSLTTAPELPAITLAQYCYGYMFYSCTSLTTAPVLSATTLAQSCYREMFNGCTNLNYIKCLATNISAYSCTTNWVSGIASTGTFVKDASMTGWTTGINGIPTGWIVEDNQVPLSSISISGETNVTNMATYTIEYTPLDTTETGVTWSVVSGSEYATIDANTGVLTVLADADSSTVVIRATSIAKPAITDEKTISTTYVPLTAISISGETNVTNNATYTVEYTPSVTTETGVTWSIVSGNQYATIDANTGELTVLSGASSSEVVIRATSIVNSSISDELTLSVTYLPLLQFTAKQDSSTLGLANKSGVHTIEYSTDGGSTWTNMTTSTNLTVNSGNSVYVRGVLSDNQSTSNYTRFKMTGNFKVSGYINHLWNKDNLNSALKQYCGYYLFSGCTALSDASELVLPATTLALYCYSYMFQRCTSLTTAPAVLPATTLANYCYNNMFNNCISLTTAPVLPATTLANNCYSNMFYNCTSLTTAPELPATTLDTGCYYYMFYKCTSLTTAPVLPATTLVNSCYQYMFSGCSGLNYITCLATNISASNCTNNWVNSVASTGTFVKDPNMTSWTTGDNGIPNGWTVQDAV